MQPAPAPHAKLFQINDPFCSTILLQKTQQQWDGTNAHYTNVHQNKCVASAFIDGREYTEEFIFENAEKLNEFFEAFDDSSAYEWYEREFLTWMADEAMDEDMAYGSYMGHEDFESDAD